MELKRVIGKDNRQAMDEVVRLYGPDALVVSGHKVRDQFEMIVAVDIEADDRLLGVPDDALATFDPDATDAATETTVRPFRKILHEGPQESATSISAPEPMEQVRVNEIVELFRSEIQSLKREMHETRLASAWQMQHANADTLSPLQQGLMEHVIPNRLKTLLVDTLSSVEQTDDEEAHLHAVLNEGLETLNERIEDLSGVHAFFGPTGAGKTTFIGKLATQAAGALGGDQVVLISLADHKLGAWNQMQLMASQLGVHCYRAKHGEMLRNILSEVADMGCILIDTGGVDLSSQYTLVQKHAPEALVHLVVPTEITRSTASKVFAPEFVWDSINLSKRDESSDSWILFDALAKRDHAPLWLESHSDSLQQAPKPINVSQWITAMIETVDRPKTSTQTEEKPEDGRQTSDAPSTLDFLAGLRANHSERTGGGWIQPESDLTDKQLL